MEKELSNSIDELVNYITSTKEYKNCIKYKELMDEDNNIKELDKLEDELNNIDTYVIYNQNLEVVNNMINYVKEDLNDYFYNLFNK